VETSGRDIGMFEYIEHFFPEQDYRKLVLNFEINEIEFAESSVECRMVGEMRAGVDAVATGETRRIIRANAGGPYGPKALAGVQQVSRVVGRRNRVVSTKALTLESLARRACFVSNYSRNALERWC
jgi:hypothetical protein